MKSRMHPASGLMLLVLAAGGCTPQPVLKGDEARLADQAVPAPNPRRNAYFGDLHVHTGYSFDAAVSHTDTVPADSYRYALGEEVSYLGQTYRRRVPLDFLAVTDHAEYLGVLRQARDPDGPFAGTKWPAQLGSKITATVIATFQQLSDAGFKAEASIPEFENKALIADNWGATVEAAEQYYRPGKFTTFAAFEWSAMPGGGHIHRNVIFKGPKYPSMPFSVLDSMHPEDLWAYAEHNRRIGSDSVLIPHNSNLSDGLMFSYKDSFGREMTQAYAEQRARNEVAVEITQTKGTSETTPGLSPGDEFAGFEILKTPRSVDDGGYVRQGLQRGLELGSRLSVNPFKYGIVGSSDSHSGMSASEEDNFVLGGISAVLGTDAKALVTEPSPIVGAPLTVMSASGLTGVWAERNTREDIFNALKRKEIFGTSGTKIQVRLFGGWSFTQGLERQRDWVAKAYRVGVPMGGDLPAHGAGNRPPGFVVQALKDPSAGNLDRIQIIKLWYEDGKSHERIYDVVWSGDRRKDPATGKVPAVGNTVDVKRATYSNTIGAAQLTGFWTDPDFKPGVPALYYARVLEIPTPRWPTYLAARNTFDLPASERAWLQERAWTSPIFYEPAA